MKRFKQNLPWVIGSIMLITIGCSDSRKKSLRTDSNNLTSCPQKPNCVYSGSQSNEHKIEPFQIVGDYHSNWNQIIKNAATLPRTRIIEKNEIYFHAECKTKFWGFKDDLEMLLDNHSGQIEVRSASRVGHSDFGVNRKRVELLRKKLLNKGLIALSIEEKGI